jgi:S1-C subfamily serine protease
MARDTEEWRRPWREETSAGATAPVAPAVQPSLPHVRPASPMTPPASWGEGDLGPGSPLGSVRPPDSTGTVDAPTGRARRGGAAVVLAALLGAVGGTLGTVGYLEATDRLGSSQVATVSLPEQDVTAPLVEMDEAGGGTVVSAVAEAVTPSVVRIDVLANQNGSLVNAGVGSGVIYRSDGYILTNNHVVRSADEVEVRFADGETATAEVVGTDRLTDLAVLKVERTGLPAINLRTGAGLRVGETAIAIGSPFGLDASVTAGVVSALNRDLQVPPQGQDAPFVIPAVIQTDAAINPGNSGGALVDAQGRLIGINTAILTGSGGSQGVGFAIPTVQAVDVAEQLIRSGTVSHPFLGVSGEDVTREVARRYADEFGIELDGGALIVEVVEGSGAAAAGIRADDIIVRVGDFTVADMTGLIVAVRNFDTGQTAEVELLRAGQRITVDVTFTERPD